MFGPAQRWVFLISFSSALCLSSSAGADSDGCYCAGPGFLAWETRFEATTPGHRLHIVTYSPEAGIQRQKSIELPDFQVHGMHCDAQAVQLEGWTAGYTVDLSPSNFGQVSERGTKRDAKGAGPLQLGHWATPAVIDLPSEGAPGEFQLVIARVDRPIEGGIEHFTFTELVRRELRPGGERLLDSLQLFQGLRLEPID